MLGEQRDDGLRVVNVQPVSPGKAMQVDPPVGFVRPDDARARLFAQRMRLPRLDEMDLDAAGRLLDDMPQVSREEAAGEGFQAVEVERPSEAAVAKPEVRRHPCRDAGRPATSLERRDRLRAR